MVVVAANAEEVAVKLTFEVVLGLGFIMQLY
jgi:hypothetical protein